MKDTSKPFRIAIATALQGNIGANLYDEKRWVQQTDTLFVILSTQQQIPSNENDCTWISRSSIDIEIIQKTGSEASKNDIDDVSNAICGLLVPAPFTTTITSSNLQFCNARVDSIISRNLAISETETILQKIIRFSCDIVEQS